MKKTRRNDSSRSCSRPLEARAAASARSLGPWEPEKAQGGRVVVVSAVAVSAVVVSAAVGSPRKQQQLRRRLPSTSAPLRDANGGPFDAQQLLAVEVDPEAANLDLGDEQREEERRKKKERRRKSWQQPPSEAAAASPPRPTA